jgi:hypothetical protein
MLPKDNINQFDESRSSNQAQTLDPHGSLTKFLINGRGIPDKNLAKLSEIF